MKTTLNLEKLAELENKYSSNSIVSNTITSMINTVLNEPTINSTDASVSFKISNDTLVELGIFTSKDDELLK